MSESKTIDAKAFLEEMATDHEESADRLAACFPNSKPPGVEIIRSKAAKLREIARMVSP